MVDRAREVPVVDGAGRDRAGEGAAGEGPERAAAGREEGGGGEKPERGEGEAEAVHR